MRGHAREHDPTPRLRRRTLLALAFVPAIAAGSAAAASARERVRGGEQSPIDIRTRDVEPAGLPPLRFEYASSATVTMTYAGTNDSPCHDAGEEETVRAEVDEGLGSLWVGEREFGLQQVHWHTGSEHLLNGRRFPLEQHLVHSDDAGNLAVVGVWLRYGRPHDTLGRLLGDLPSECTPDRTVEDVDLGQLLPEHRRTFRYAGSLTTEPYTEGVSWILCAQAVAVSRAQAAEFASLFPLGNSRAVQPLNGRTVRTETAG